MGKDSPVTRGELATRLVGFAMRRDTKTGRIVTAKVGGSKTNVTRLVTSKVSTKLEEVRSA